MIEIWKDIEGYEGAYQISNCGTVKSLKRTVSGKLNSIRTLKEKIKATAIKRDGYLCMYLLLLNTGLRKKFSLHRLVATYFVSNPDNKPDVNHKDGNKKNNCADNLEWVTKSENTLHAYKTGLKSPMKGELNGMVKLTEQKVIAIKERYNEGNTSYRILSIEYGVDKALIARIIKGKAWPHVTLKTA